ncbi:hypothetical protein, partial [Lentzea sp.]|uniref:hypothetical protein n=1 Tax=Lentzea sp. TaxID=56099 RepID=UPI002ED054F8
SDEVTRTQDVMLTLGRMGVVVSDYRRVGAVVSFKVPTISIATLGIVISAFIASSAHLSGVERWVIKQEDSSVPELVISAEAVATTVECLGVSADGRKTIDTGTSPLPVIAAALCAHGMEPGVVVNALVALASSHVLGEHQRLTADLSSGDAEAVQELAAMMMRLELALGAAIKLVQLDAQDMLQSYLRLVRRAHEAFVSAPQTVHHSERWELSVALQSARPAKLPWISEQQGC